MRCCSTSSCPTAPASTCCARCAATATPRRSIVVTARDAVSDRVAGLDAGADDYLIKPFHLDELAARLRSIHRRSRGLSNNVVVEGRLTLRHDQRRCHVRRPAHRLVQTRIPAAARADRTRRARRLARHARESGVRQRRRRQQRARSSRACAAPQTFARQHPYRARAGLHVRRRERRRDVAAQHASSCSCWPRSARCSCRSRSAAICS